MSAPHRGVHLPFDLWPEQDQADWNELFREGDLLDGRGAACHWAPKTRKTNLQHYARWLSWLKASERLDAELSTPRRATPEAVHTYTRSLMVSLSPRTVASAVIGLKCVLQRQYPEEDWRWLKDLTNRLDAWAEAATVRNRKILPADLVFESAISELSRLAATPSMSRRSQTLFRDALIVALLTCCPIRIRNLTQIQIGKHLHKAGAEWHLAFGAHETKTGQPVRYVVPSMLVPWLAFYLERVRPGFPLVHCHDGLWPGSEGRPLAYDSLYSRIILTTKRLFSLAVNPHSFRTMAATALAERSPEDALFARPLLGHRSPRTTERHYIRANQLLASLRINRTLSEIRDSGFYEE